MATLPPASQFVSTRAAKLGVKRLRSAEPGAAGLASAGVSVEADWRLLTAGDEVSIAGQGRFRIVHLSHAKAWIANLQDESQRLVDASCLRLRGLRARARGQLA